MRKLAHVAARESAGAPTIEGNEPLLVGQEARSRVVATQVHSIRVVAARAVHERPLSQVGQPERAFVAGARLARSRSVAGLFRAVSMSLIWTDAGSGSSEEIRRACPIGDRLNRCWSPCFLAAPLTV